jgi:hypothetical protein
MILGKQAPVENPDKDEVETVQINRRTDVPEVNNTSLPGPPLIIQQPDPGRRPVEPVGPDRLGIGPGFLELSMGEIHHLQVRRSDVCSLQPNPAQHCLLQVGMTEIRTAKVGVT